MLTIQPKVSAQKTNFGTNRDKVQLVPVYYMGDEQYDRFMSDKHFNPELEALRYDIQETMDNLNEIQSSISNKKGKKILNGFITLGTAALSGISVAFGYDQTSKALGKLFTKPSMKKLGGNLKKPFVAVFKFVKKYAGKLAEKFKKTNLFAKLSKKLTEFKSGNFYTKSAEKFNKVKTSKFGEKVSQIYQNIKGVKAAQVNNVVGSTLGVATGVSTAVATNLDNEEVMVA